RRAQPSPRAADPRRSASLAPHHSPDAFLRGAAFFVSAARLAAGFLAAGRLVPLRLAPPADGVFSLAAATEALRASIRSTTRAGASSAGASIGSPAGLLFAISRIASPRDVA